MTSKYKLVSADRIKSLKREIYSLTNENRELKKRIIELENEKLDDKSVTNIIEKKVRDSLNDYFLREYKHPDPHKYEPRLDGPDWTYRPDRDNLDWSYWPRRGTTGPYYPYPGYPPQVGDWPPGPQVGDWPPGPQIGDTPRNPLPDDFRPYPFPWWGICPPEWNWPSIPNTVNTNTTGDYNPQECHM